MSYFLGHSLKIQLKLYIIKKSYCPKFFSALYPISYKFSSFKTKENSLKLNQVNEIHHRNFSFQDVQNFYVGIYNSVTSSTASQLLKENLIHCHDITGLPWWVTIVLATAALKLFVSLPLGAYQQYLVARIKNTKDELDVIAKKIKKEVLIEAKREKWTLKKANRQLNHEIRKQWSILVVKNNCHPFKTVIILLAQLPVWILMSLTLRKFSSDVNLGISDAVVAALQFQVGGLFWSPNLTLPDSTLILPTIITLVNLVLIEINTLSSTHVLNLLSKISVNFCRLFCVLAFYISANTPSCLSLFWATSAVFSLAQSLLLLNPRARRFCRIPETSQDLKKPYSHIYNKLIENWSSFGSKLSRFFFRK